MFLEVMYHTRTTFTGRFERDSELYTDPRRRSSLLFSYLCTVKVLFFLQDIYETHHLNVIYLFWHDILTLLLLWINFDTQDWRFHFYFSNITTWWSFKVPLKLQLKVTLPFIVIETLKKKEDTVYNTQPWISSNILHSSPFTGRETNVDNQLIPRSIIEKFSVCLSWRNRDTFMMSQRINIILAHFTCFDEHSVWTELELMVLPWLRDDGQHIYLVSLRQSTLFLKVFDI